MGNEIENREQVRKEYAEFLTWYDLGEMGKTYLSSLGYEKFTKTEFAEKHNITRECLRLWERDLAFWQDSGFEELQKMIMTLIPKASVIAAKKGNLKDLRSMVYPEKQALPIGSLVINNNQEPASTENKNSGIQRLYYDILDFCSRAGIPSIIHYMGRYIDLHGGRAGGKSEIAARFVIWLCRNAKNANIICGRELQRSIKNSVKSLLDRIIFEYDLGKMFVSTEQEIYCPLSGSKIIFLGLKSATESDSLKSIDNLFFVWGEEAQSLRMATIDKVDPTIRGRSSKVVDLKEGEDFTVLPSDDGYVEMIDGTTRKPQLMFTWNPQLDADPIKDYLETKKPMGVLSININYDQNPFLPKELLMLANTEKATNFSKWLHIWKGEPQKFFEDSMWPGDLISKMRKTVGFFRENYSRVVVACDPAQTDKEFSNEYGIVAAGITMDGEGHCIADLSGNYSPNAFAQKAIDAYYLYEADAIVVETNAGGDFIKSTILTIDPRVVVKEVRASQDKMKRSVPVANLAQMGRIYHICGGFPKIESQMARMTTRGFEGAPGESPDRLDAYNWGFIELFGLSEKQTTELIFKKSMFIRPAEAKTMIENVIYLGWDGALFGAILCDIIQAQDQSMKFLIKDYAKGPKEEVAEYLEDCLVNSFTGKDKIEINIPDDITGTPLINKFSQRFMGIIPISTENYITKPLEERIIQVIPYIQNGQVCVADSLPIKKYNNIRGDLFMLEVTEYNPESKVDRPILASIVNALFLENKIII